MKPGNGHIKDQHELAPDDGPKHDFRKVTITLPQETYERVVKECARRKVAGERNHLISSLIREAVSNYFSGDLVRAS